MNHSLPLRTPNIDSLAEHGIRFTRAYCNSPLCAPSRACLASGRDYPACGVANNDEDYSLDMPTYYQSLRHAGYRVAGVGKLDLHKATLDWGVDGSRLLPEWGFSDGIDNEGKLDGSKSFRRSAGPKGPYLRFLAERGLAEIYVQEHARRIEHRDAYTTELPDEAYCDNWIAENGLRILADLPRNQPWHLVVNFTGPHNPMDVTASMRERWKETAFPLPHANSQTEYSESDHLRNRQNYAAMIENIDRLVGRFVDTVNGRGELEETIIVYASDHGEMLGDHNRWGKSIWREQSVAVPLVISGPGIQQGRTSESLVALHDLAATFVDYGKAEPLPRMDARSLRGLLEGTRRSHRDYVLSGLDRQGEEEMRQGQAAGDTASSPSKWRVVVDRRYKLVRSNQGTLLFDLERDPWEDHDIAGSEPEVVRRMEDLLSSSR